MFQRLYRKKIDELPPSTPLQAQKKRQIENIKANYENVTEVVNEIDYRIPIKAGNTYLTLIILLPPHFPQDGPTIHVSPSISHPWVNKEQQIIGCTSLKNFTMHSDLGRIIQEIIQEFTKRPPVVDTLTHQDLLDHSLAITAYPHVPTALVGHPYIPITPYTEIRSVDVLADKGFHFPELKNISIASLENLNTDDETLNEFVDALPSAKYMQLDLNSLRNENDSLASANVEKQPAIQSLKQNITMKADVVTALKVKFEQQHQCFQSLTEQYSPAALAEQLKISVLQSEEESDRLALNFLDSSLGIDEFLTKFTEKRTLYHLRRIKEEKLQVHT